MVEFGRFYQHKYGGVYRADFMAKHTETKDMLVVHTHIYPFEKSVLAKPVSLWTEDRFRLLSSEELVALLRKDKAAFQEEIVAAKNKGSE